MKPAIVFDGVWKQFRRGERHDSFRDLIPAVARRILSRTREDGGDTFWAVRDVSFAVSPGQALGIIGPNGAGKSTTLKLLTRILKPTRGTCHLTGRVGALIEVAAGFHPDLTGRENIYLQGAIMGMKRREIASRFDEIVDFAGVGPFIDTPVKRYSSGMNARLGFSIAAHLNPQVLIIDEVLAVGDVAFQERCFTRMQSFLREGVALVLVSHNLPAVSRLCGTTLMLKGGQAVASGPSTEVIAEYCRTETQSASAHQGAGRIGLTVSTPDLPTPPTIQPGSQIRINVGVEYREDVPAASIGINVWDIAHGACAYSVASDAAVVPLLSGSAGTAATYEFQLYANLPRGTYAIEVNVLDMNRHEQLARLMPAAQFTVFEQVTYGGTANLFLTGLRVDGAQPKNAARERAADPATVALVTDP